jgi:Domain of unknown function (DUF4190)
MSEQPPYPPQDDPWSAGQPSPPPAAPQYAYAPQPRQTAGGAVTALVLGILGLVMCGPFTSIPAIIVGRKATREIDASQGHLEGRGMAQAGFVLGIVGTVLYGLMFLFVIVVFVFGGLVASTFEDTCSIVQDDDTTSSVPC